MTRQRALRLAREWAQGHKCSLRDGEAAEYHSMFAAMLEESMPNEPLTLDSRLTPKIVTCPKGWKGVRYTRFHCPGCKKVVKKGEAYCHKCGQALVFPIQRYDKENNRIWLDLSNRRPLEGEEDA